MSGIASGIGKVFSAVGSGVARVGQAVLGVGATAFTAGAATGAGSMASGGLSGLISKFTGSGVLGNILTGAVTQAGYGALLGGAVGALTGQGFGKGAMIGGLSGAVTGGLSGGGLFSAAGTDHPAMTSSTGVTPSASPTPTGMTATGTTVGAGAPGQVSASAPATSSGGGLFDFLKSETGGSLIAGVGQGLLEKSKVDAEAAENQKNRQYLLDKEKRLTDSYSVPTNVLPGGLMSQTPASPQPVPALPTQAQVAPAAPASTAQAGAPPAATAFRYQYDPQSRNVIRVPA